MNEKIDLQHLPLVARGGQAGIYDFGNDRVLRVPSLPRDFDRIRYEYQIYTMLNHSETPVPKVYDLLEADGVPMIVMERLHGHTMMDEIKKHPFRAKAKSAELARLQNELLNIHVSAPVRDIKASARYCVGASGRLSDTVKARVIEILDLLPDGDSLCHGDFHPGNIICQNGDNYIIDWSGASRGDYHCDIAHTYILLKVVPRAPGVGPIMHLIQKLIGRSLASTYLESIESMRDVDRRTLARWVLVKAAERTFYGLPSEQGHLVGFINACVASDIAPGADERFLELL